MATVSSTGIASGLDVSTLVPALVNAVIGPKQTAHDNSLSQANSAISNIGKIQSSLSSLQNALANLTSTSSMYSLTTSLSDSSYFTAAISPTSTTPATKGTYQVEVQQLAQRQSLATGYVVDPNHIGTGSVVINFGSYNSSNVFSPNPDFSNPALNINVTGSDSLEDVKNAINAGSSNVTASIVKDSKGSRLTLTSNSTGEQYAMQITGSLSALNYDPASSSSALNETVKAQNSLVKINGLVVSNATNELNDTIPGLNINLQKASLGTTITLGVNDDTQKVKDAVNSFITQYNATTTLINGLTDYDSVNQKAGALQFDPQIRALKLSLGNIINTTTTDSTSSVYSIADLGITLDGKGLLQLNQATFDDTSAKHYKDIGGLFIKSSTSAGIATQLNDLVDSYNAASSGQFAQKTTLLNQQVKLLSDQQNRITQEKTTLTNRYMAQFSALDTLLSKLQSTSSFLTQQAASTTTTKV